MNPLFSNYERILFAPLNWGLGHATRSMVLIDQCLSANKEVAIASDGIALELLKKEYPGLSFFDLPPYDVHYKGSSFVTNLSLQLPKILGAMRKEKKIAKKICKTWQPDLIISDNRYGFWDASIKSILLTHQLRPYFKNPLLSVSVRLLVHFLTKNFHEIWVPDDSKRSLSGELSKSGDKRTKYIGSLSRIQPESSDNPEYRVFILLSGPEPKRSELEEKLLIALKKVKNMVLVRGTTKDMSIDKSIDLKKVINLANKDQIESLASNSQIIISRSGYSTVMDLYELKTIKIIIPTPGQTEQEYLAVRLDGKKGFIAINEDKIEVQLIELINQL